MRKPTFGIVASLVLLVVNACGSSSDSTTTPSKVLASIAVVLTSSTLTVGGTEEAFAAGTDQAGASISLGVVQWSSSSPSVATVSGSGVITALAAGQTSITAAFGGKQGVANLTVVSQSQTGSLTLASGGQLGVFLDSPNFQTTLNVQSGGQYLIEVVNTDRAPSQREDSTLVGGNGTSGNVLAMARASIAADAPMLDTHLSMLERNRTIFAQRGNPRSSARTTSRSALAELTSSISQSIGAVNRVWVPRLNGAACTDADSIGARTVAVGQHVIVLADTDQTRWPPSLRPDSSYYRSFADEYDQVTWPHILENIGNPLGYDGQLSRLGKITVAITPLLNGNSNGSGSTVVAFVDLCDFFPFVRTGNGAALSNETEIFYSWVPGSSGYDPVAWGKALRATASHETKHLVAYTDRILNNSSQLEEIWLEEGLAQESSEIWERHFSTASWKSHANFLQTVTCELNFGSAAPCDAQNNKPYNLLAGHLPFFFEYLQSESTSQSEGLGVDTPSNYGAGWAFARWATDQYAATTEGDFIKALVNEPTLVGLPNLVQHTGQSSVTLLAYWNLANAIFQVPNYTPADVRATNPSFDFANIFSNGQQGTQFCGSRGCHFFTSSGTPVFPVQPIALASGSFSQTMTGIRGTSAVYFLLTANASGTQTLKLANPAGGSLSSLSGLRVAIMRVQ